LALFCVYGWKWENKPDYEWGGYYANYLEVNSFDVRTQPLSILYGGIVFDGQLNFASMYGYYWTSTGDSGGTYRLSFYPDSLYPSSYDWRYYGYSIRCLAR